MKFDALCKQLTSQNINLLIPWWIMAAYAYDQMDDPIISDDLFDKIAVDIDDNWSIITHRHKDRLDRTLLKSSIAISGNWPSITKGAVQSLKKIDVHSKIVEKPKINTLPI